MALMRFGIFKVDKICLIICLCICCCLITSCFFLKVTTSIDYTTLCMVVAIWSSSKMLKDLKYRYIFFLYYVAQVYKMFSLSFCATALWRRPSATWHATPRVSSCAATTTAGVDVPPSSLTATAPSWISEPWKRAFGKAGRLGSPWTMSLLSQVRILPQAWV